MLERRHGGDVCIPELDILQPGAKARTPGRRSAARSTIMSVNVAKKPVHGKLLMLLFCCLGKVMFYGVFQIGFEDRAGRRIDIFVNIASQVDISRRSLGRCE